MLQECTKMGKGTVISFCYFVEFLLIYISFIVPLKLLSWQFLNRPFYCLIGQYPNSQRPVPATNSDERFRWIPSKAYFYFSHYYEGPITQKNIQQE